MLYQLQRIFMGPFEFFFGEDGLFGSQGEHERSQAMWSGLPAIAVAVIGGGLLIYANYGIESSLEATYVQSAEKAAERKRELAVEIGREVALLRASNRLNNAGESGSIASLIPDDNPLKLEYNQLVEEEELYLQKLIDLNPTELKYQYLLGQALYSRGQPTRGLPLIQLAAPTEEPGYLDAHLFLAQQNQMRAVRGGVSIDSGRYLDLVKIHAEHALKRDGDNLAAREFLARVYLNESNLPMHLEMLVELFASDVKYFIPLAQAHQRSGDKDRRQEVLKTAARRLIGLQADVRNQLRDNFRKMAAASAEGENDQIEATTLELEKLERAWNQNWDLSFECHVMMGAYTDIEAQLLAELEWIEQNGQFGEEMGALIKRRLVLTYLRQMGEIDPNSPDFEAQRLELVKRAASYEGSHPVVLSELTMLGLDSPAAVAQAARELYSPENDTNAPATVLNALGGNALSESNYVDAIRFFEAARLKEPKNSQYLNNLAYSYLSVDPPMPARALKLIDEALTFMPAANRRAWESNFRDTRGLALKMLGRLPEAITEFELALVDRPENESTLRAITACYYDLSLDPIAYVKRMRQLGYDAPEPPPATSSNFPGNQPSESTDFGGLGIPVNDGGR